MSRKAGHGAEEKVSIVRRVMKCEISIRAASREVGVNRETPLPIRCFTAIEGSSTPEEPPNLRLPQPGYLPGCAKNYFPLSS